MSRPVSNSTHWDPADSVSFLFDHQISDSVCIVVDLADHLYSWPPLNYDYGVWSAGNPMSFQRTTAQPVARQWWTTTKNVKLRGRPHRKHPSHLPLSKCVRCRSRISQFAQIAVGTLCCWTFQSILWPFVSVCAKAISKPRSTNYRDWIEYVPHRQ